MSDGVFLVTRTRGPRWDDGRAMEAQDGWRAHADFMTALAREGFVALGGPITGTRDTLLVIRARDEPAIEARLAGDPWTRTELLRLVAIRPWTLRLGSLPPGPG